MRVRVLGPLELEAGGGLLPLGAAKQRTVLALLLARANAVVSLDEIIDEVWAERPPPSAAANARMYAANLRRLLAAVSDGPSIVKRGPAYVLTVDPYVLDVSQFRDLLRQGRESMTSDHAVAVSRFTDALALWRGPAVADVPVGRILSGWRTGLEEERLSALELRVEALLAAGEFADAGAQARELIAVQPLRERVHELVIRARYEAGDAAGALAAFEACRRTLREELGVEPGEELRRLQRLVLEGGSTQRSTSPSRQPGPDPVAPRQLPADVATFTGRAVQLRRLDSLMSAGGSSAVVISAIAGTAGVGKTALAVHWAHRTVGQFPDGQLYVNLRGFDASGSATTSAEAIRVFLDAFEVPPQRIPTSLAAQVGLYRSLLADKRMLIVLDNARDAEQVRPLLPGAPGCLTLVTSRNRLTSLVAAEGAYPLELDLLTRDEARQFLIRRLGASRVGAEQQAVDELIDRCAGLPLALAIVAARAAVLARPALTDLAYELREAGSGLDALDGGDMVTNVRAVLSWSYRALSTPAARLFRQLGLHPGPDVSEAAAASLNGRSADDVRPLLSELVEAHLISESHPGRYAFHDLMRAYASELAYSMDTDEERHAVRRRLLDHYLRTAASAALLIHSYRDPIDFLPTAPDVFPERLVDHSDAMAWLSIERHVLTSVVQAADAAGFNIHVWQLAWTLTTFFQRQGHWHDQVNVQHIALGAARRLNDKKAQTHALRSLARVCATLGQLDDAHDHLLSALELLGELGDVAGQAHAHHNRSLVFEHQGRHHDALREAELCLDLYRAAGHRSGQALALNAVGWYLALVGDYRRALSYCQEALTIHRDLGNRVDEADTWSSLGLAQHRLGHHEQAISSYRTALDLYRLVGGDRYNQARVLAHLAEAYDATMNISAASNSWREALAILEELGHSDADRVRAKLGELVASSG